MKDYYPKLNEGVKEFLFNLVLKLIDMDGILEWALLAGAAVARLEKQNTVTIATGSQASQLDMRNNILIGIRHLLEQVRTGN